MMENVSNLSIRNVKQDILMCISCKRNSDRTGAKTDFESRRHVDLAMFPIRDTEFRARP